jgi:hypothetical protein
MLGPYRDYSKCKKERNHIHTKACESRVYGYLAWENNGKEYEFNIFASLMGCDLEVEFAWKTCSLEG